jgi:hypothetical protein
MNNNLIIRILDIAKEGIVQFYDITTGLFNFIMTDDKIKNEDNALLLIHSLISLLGISYHKDLINIDFQKSLDSIFRLIISKDSDIREYSLLLWLLAKENDGRAEQVFKRIDRLSDRQICRVSTMELAWLLTALSFIVRINDSVDIKRRLFHVVEHLNRRFIKKTGIFLHRDKKEAKWDIRYNIANFADQIYSIYALSIYTYITKDARYLEVANNCARKICFLQGEKGQWWWHYNALTGKVMQKYPVFSVHQDSMAPFALMALSQVSEVDYNYNIFLGLRWIFKENELGYNMINENRNFIRRGVERNYLFAKIAKLMTITENYHLTHGIPEKYDQPKYLRVINWGCSYHLGWILNAYNKENKYMWSKI